MVGWGTEAKDIDNPQKVASSEGEELYVGTSPPPYLMWFVNMTNLVDKKLLEKSELLKGLMQGTYPHTPSCTCSANS